MTISTDFCVVGVGSAGSFALRTLARAGHKVIGVEAGGVANDRCAVGGDTRLYRRLYKEGQAYYPLLERAREIWLEFNETEPDSFTECGSLTIVDADSEAAAGLAAYGERFGLDYEQLEHRELFSRFDQFVPHEDVVGFLDPSGGYLRTDVVVRRAAAEAQAAGAAILDSFATAVVPDDTGVTVETENETIRCEKVIVTAGARSRALLPQLESLAAPRRLTMTWFQATEPSRFASARCPVFSWFFPDHYIYGVPTVDGRHVKVSGMIETAEMEFDGFDYDASVSRATIRAAAEVAQETMCGVHPIPVRSGIYPDLYSADHDFILDFVDSGQRVFAATGFSGKGFKMSSALGKHAALAVTGEATLFPAFSLSRFGD